MPDDRDPGIVDLLGRDDAEALTAAGRTLRFRRGSMLMREGDASDRVVVLQTGRVKITQALPDGRESVLGIRGPGSLLGEFSALDGQPRSATVTALEDVVVTIIAISDFEQFLTEHPHATLALLRLVIGRLRESDRRRTALGATNVTTRLARHLLDLASLNGTARADGSVHIQLPITQEELAGLIGASREAVTKSLRQLRDEGAVTTARKAVTLLDLDRLRQHAS